MLEPVPPLSTFLRAVRRDLTAGERAGLAAGADGGPHARCLRQAGGLLTQSAGEADHVQAPLLVDADDDLVRP
ncbi:hypothetical protein [Streptomyces anandii]|uniref:hypothetical protein n=1 Tax=Streptomyces anandii TaxID=285454 RepID=UPI003694B96D